MEADARDRFIKRVVKGRSFADCGGLWGTVNERVSVAHGFGAASLTMIDVTPLDTALWESFRTRMDSCGIEDYACISSDICLLDDARFDVVHCSGVLYHHPDPISLISALRRVTREHLVLTSAITQETIENELGSYRVPSSAVVFVPALEEKERAILGRYWHDVGAEIDGIHRVVEYDVDDFGPWWWLPTAHALTKMAESAGFRVIDEAYSWNGNAYTLLLSAPDGPPAG